MIKNIVINRNGRVSYWNNKIFISFNGYEDNRDNNYENNMNKRIQKSNR